MPDTWNDYAKKAGYEWTSATRLEPDVWVMNRGRLEAVCLREHPPWRALARAGTSVAELLSLQGVPVWQWHGETGSLKPLGWTRH